MKSYVWLTAAIAFALAGCTGQPLVSQREISWQAKLQTAAHWEQIAETTAGRILTTLADDPVATHPSGYVIAGTNVPSRAPIYIQSPDAYMPFARAFHDLLMKAFLDRGAVVVSSPARAVTVNYDVQFFAYDGRRTRAYVPGTFTVLTTLGALGWQAGENWSDSSQRAALFAIGPVLDGLTIGYRILSEKPNAEVLITTTVMDGTRYVLRNAELYYVSESDAPLYADVFPTRPALHRAAAPAEPAPVRPVRIVSP